LRPQRLLAAKSRRRKILVAHRALHHQQASLIFLNKKEDRRFIYGLLRLTRTPRLPARANSETDTESTRPNADADAGSN
jgi:hypothetical protein